MSERVKERRGEREIEGLIYMRNWLIQYGGWKSHDLRSANWRTRQPSGIVQPESKGLRAKRPAMQTPVQGQNKMG